MGLLETAVDPGKQSYLDARAATLAALAELETALDAAREGGGERAVTRHHARGKLLARERIELLVDRDSPLLELSPVAGWSTTTPVGAAVVTAIGVIEDRTCVLVATDPTVRGGAASAATLRKLLRAQEIAYQNRLPVVCLLETSGYEPAEHSEIFMLAGRVVAEFARLAAARIPTSGTFFGEIGSRSDKPNGELTGLSGADLSGSFDYLVALAPPASGRHLDHLAEDERDALRLTRQCVQRFPRGRGHPRVPVAPPAHDPEDLLAIPPTEPREILGRILDGSEFDEVQPEYGGAVCAGWGTLHGHPVAALANVTGAPGAAEAEKAARLVRHAELSGTPLLFLRHGELPAAGAETAVTAAVANAAVPVLAVRVGSWHGLCALGRQARFRFAWPGADAGLDPRPAATGEAPVAGDNGDAREAGEAGETGAGSASALALSGQLDDDGVIDPRDTRTVLGICLSVIQPSVIQPSMNQPSMIQPEVRR